MIWGKRYIAGERQQSRLPLVLSLLAVLLVAGVALLVWEWQHQPQFIDPNIAMQLKFSPFIVTKGSGAKVVAQKYDAASEVYFSVIQIPEGQKFTVSEQASPANFSEIPELYSKLLDGLHKYDTLETINGTVSLTRPTNNESEAVLNEKGVLMFVHADTANVSKSTWKRLIESFDIYKLPK